ncbi:MAG: hypothetical protein RL764_544 [Pseudomonadota bacterium]
MPNMAVAGKIALVVVFSGSVGAALYESRQQAIGQYCRLLEGRETLRQLKACNSLLRHEYGCLLPSRDKQIDRSCLDRGLSNRIYRNCVEERRLWVDLSSQTGGDSIAHQTTKAGGDYGDRACVHKSYHPDRRHRG